MGARYNLFCRFLKSKGEDRARTIGLWLKRIGVKRGSVVFHVQRMQPSQPVLHEGRTKTAGLPLAEVIVDARGFGGKFLSRAVQFAIMLETVNTDRSLPPRAWTATSQEKKFNALPGTKLKQERKPCVCSISLNRDTRESPLRSSTSCVRTRANRFPSGQPCHPRGVRPLLADRPHIGESSPRRELARHRRSIKRRRQGSTGFRK